MSGVTETRKGLLALNSSTLEAASAAVEAGVVPAVLEARNADSAAPTKSKIQLSLCDLDSVTRGNATVPGRGSALPSGSLLARSTQGAGPTGVTEIDQGPEATLPQELGGAWVRSWRSFGK